MLVNNTLEYMEDKDARYAVALEGDMVQARPDSAKAS